MHTEETKKSKTVSVKLPRIQLPSLQAFILILLIVVGALQTAQLYGLNSQISSGQANTGPATVSQSPINPSNSVTSSLPDMVGGC